jgi:type IV secretory pathway VirB10-like protein
MLRMFRLARVETSVSVSTPRSFDASVCHRQNNIASVHSSAFLDPCQSLQLSSEPTATATVTPSHPSHPILPSTSNQLLPPTSPSPPSRTTSSHTPFLALSPALPLPLPLSLLASLQTHQNQQTETHQQAEQHTNKHNTQITESTTTPNATTVARRQHRRHDEHNNM